MVVKLNSSAIRLATNTAGIINKMEWGGGVVGEGELTNDEPIGAGSLSAFNSFTPHELAFMSLRGIPIIDLQGSCPNQCYGCGCDAEKFDIRKAMSPVRIKALIHAGTDLREMGYGLFPRGVILDAKPKYASLFSLFLFFGSNLVSYRGRDEDGSVWTMYDPIDRFQAAFGTHMALTLAPWKHGDSFQTRAVQRTIERAEIDEDFSLGNTYSMKMLGGRACKEYDRFIEALVQREFLVSVEELISTEAGFVKYERLCRAYADDFISGAQCVADMVDNIQTMLGNRHLTISTSAVIGRKTLNGKLKRYAHLFSTDMIRRVRKHCERRLEEEKDRIKFRQQNFLGAAPRSRELLRGVSLPLAANLERLESGLLFDTEIGDSWHRSLEVMPGAFMSGDIDGGTKMSARLIAMQLGWKNPGDRYLDLYRFYSMLSSAGEISIWYGKSASSFANVKVPREYFVARAEHHEAASTGDDDHATMARHYRMLAGLIGKNIFA